MARVRVVMKGQLQEVMGKLALSVAFRLIRITLREHVSLMSVTPQSKS